MLAKLLEDQPATNSFTEDINDITSYPVPTASQTALENSGLDTTSVNAPLTDQLKSFRKSVMLYYAEILRGRLNIHSGIVKNELGLGEEVLQALWGGRGLITQEKFP